MELIPSEGERVWTDPRREFDIEEILYELGFDPDTIAISLNSLGITGCRSDPLACPIKQYLSRKLREKGILVRLLVGTSDIEVYQGNKLLNTFKLPPETSHFIREFDGGRFDFLLPNRGQKELL